MRTILLTSLLMGVSLPAYADIACHITDQKGNQLTYTFAPAKNADNFIELSFDRNGSTHNSRADDGTYPLWAITISGDGYIAGLRSRIDPDWSISYYLNPHPNVGAATLFHNTNMAGSGQCVKLHASPAYTKPPVVANNNDAVTLDVDESGGMFVRVRLPGYTAKMKIDTGADIGAVVVSLADQLIADGAATEAAPGVFNDAFGKSQTLRTIVVKSLTIGSHTVYNIQMSVSPDNADMLLGIDALRALRATVNPATNQLIFGAIS